MSVNLRQNILWWILNIFAFSIPLSSFVSVRLLVLASVFGLFAGNTRQLFLRLSRNAWDLILFIATLLFGLSYTINVDTGIRVLETSYSLLALPLIFAFKTPMDKSKIYRLFLMYVLGLAIGCLLMLGISFLKYVESLNLSEFTYYNLTDSLGFQPTYYAYYLILGISGFLYGTYYEWVKAPLGLILTVLTFFYLTLILSGGVTALIGLIFILAFFILKYLLDKRTTRKSVVFFFSSVMLFLVLGLSYYDSLGAGPDFRTDYWERGILWRMAIDANLSPIFGVGTGDYREVLNDYFVQHDMRAFANESLNSHNQYIQTYFSNGLIGLVSLLVLLLRPFYFSYRDQNPLGILFIFPFIIYGVTEVFLGRYQGVVLFVFVHQFIMLMHQEQQRNKFTLNDSERKSYFNRSNN